MGDLISRAALLEEFRSLCGPQTGNGWDNLGVRSLIMRQKSVDAEPVRHGRWIKMTGMLPPEYHGHYYCSECQWHMRGIRNSWTREEELLYCPNCGARMEADDEKES